jgi:hypothetical protein
MSSIATEVASEVRLLNESAIRQHALECSKRNRAGYFTRVGEDFIQEVQTDVDCLIRNIRNKDGCLHAVVPVDGNFVTGNLMEEIQIELNGLIGRIIQNKVQRQPTKGCTLRATR